MPIDFDDDQAATHAEAHLMSSAAAVVSAPTAPRLAGRRWCFTAWPEDHLPPDEKVALLKKCIDTSQAAIHFIIFQIETAKHGEDQGKLHAQGYLELNIDGSRGMPFVKKLFNPVGGFDRRVNVRLAKGTAQENIDYCTKHNAKSERYPGTEVIRRGEPKIDGTTEDKAANRKRIREIDALVDKMLRCGRLLNDIEFKDGVRNPELTDEMAYRITVNRRHFESTERVVQHNIVQSKSERPVKVHVFWGPAACGKTSEVFRLWNPKDVYIWDVEGQDGKWWCGYTGQKVLVINDFWGQRSRFGSRLLELQRLLGLLEGYPTMLQTKGSQVMAAWDHVVITSNIHPEEWYDRGLPTCEYTEKQLGGLYDRDGRSGRIRPGNVLHFSGEPKRGDVEPPGFPFKDPNYKIDAAPDAPSRDQ